MAGDTVLVAGGGIAGLALAKALTARDVPVQVCERDTAVPWGGLAINLPGNAIAALGRLGVGDGLERLGRPVPRREYRTAKGRLLFEVDEAAFWGLEALPRCVRRRDLLGLLHEPGVPRLAATVKAARPTGEVLFADGLRVSSGFVAGADGVRSAVRESIFGGTGLRPAAPSAASWRFMAPNPGIDCWTVWSGEQGAFLLIPVDGDEVYGCASATRGGPVEPDPVWLAETFAGYPWPVRDVVTSVLNTGAHLYHSPIEEVRVERWAAGRCVLIGDAAHATAPEWAQGGALAVEDALVLADLLAEGDWDTVGARYEQRRRSRVAHVQAATDRSARAAGLPIVLRDLMLPMVGPRGYRAAYGPLRVPA